MNPRPLSLESNYRIMKFQSWKRSGSPPLQYLYFIDRETETQANQAAILRSHIKQWQTKHFSLVSTGSDRDHGCIPSVPKQEGFEQMQTELQRRKKVTFKKSTGILTVFYWEFCRITEINIFLMFIYTTSNDQLFP